MDIEEDMARCVARPRGARDKEIIRDCSCLSSFHVDVMRPVALMYIIYSYGSRVLGMSFLYHLLCQ